jgi:hypothetical protein
MENIKDALEKSIVIKSVDIEDFSIQYKNVLERSLQEENGFLSINNSLYEDFDEQTAPKRRLSLGNWNGGENLSTNKLSLLLNDMQVIFILFCLFII